MHVVFYGLPEAAHFYLELVDVLREAEEGGLADLSATVLFSRFDRAELERVVGADRCLQMLQSKKRTFVFT